MFKSFPVGMWRAIKGRQITLPVQTSEHAVAAVLSASDEVRVACVTAWLLVHGLSLLLLHDRIDMDPTGRAARIEQVTGLFAESLGKSGRH